MHGEELLNQLVRDEGPSVTKTDLLRWAKLFDKEGKNQQTLEIYEWMMRQKMTLSASKHGVHVDLIGKTKGLAAAENCFNNLDPCDRNHSTYLKLLKWYCRGLEEDKARQRLFSGKWMISNLSLIVHPLTI
ncbi:unnamed protein product [Arabis nemorensis]|uniref:Pentacotripeptide-repeat region of PRORP domain-containing protein n=1 Tax=Arabis nemorensis TaxID=586526 RepID=A0A565C9N5_9BRAS|nr:unnamed protein product [Arabis nemorensis]